MIVLNIAIQLISCLHMGLCLESEPSIIDFPNLGSTYNGWCTATETDETLITRPSREVNVK